MIFRTYSVCESNFESQWISIPSASKKDVVYDVLIDPVFESVICECESYQYRKMCRHIEEAFAKMCLWDERYDEPQMVRGICPKCKVKNTKVVIENVEA